MKRKVAERDSPSPVSVDNTSHHEATPVKVKQEESVADYSQDVKKRLGTASRTGTACDRCRVRKMRCDDQPDGCASCHQAQAECKTTDRITGKAFVRGYMEDLETRLQELELRNKELEAQVQYLTGEARPEDMAQTTLSYRYSQLPNGTEPRQDSSIAGPAEGQAPHLSSNNNRRGYEGGDALIHDGPVRLPEFRGGLSGNNYLGISSGNSLVNMVRGTAMNVMGMEFDITDYMSPDLDEPDLSRAAQPCYNKSYRAFIQTAFGISPRLQKVELPPRSEGIKYALVFFRVTHPYAPCMHKPTFMRLLARMYDEPEFKFSAAETALVHAMFAIIYCQFASRGAKDAAQEFEFNQSSNFHYHYALGHFAELMASHTLADVQALALLCVHVRNLPKPGASWMLTSITLNLAIELGLHRSAKNWAATVKRSVLEIETRKRVFWSINWILVLVGGSLGRPMALKAEDWDVEMPEMIDDELLSEDGIDRSRPGRCNFLVGIQNFKIIPIYMDLYSNIYAVKRNPHSYEATVRSLERRIADFIKQWPRELVDESSPEKEVARVHLQYLHLWQLHIRLLLRHPSLSLSSSPEFNAESLTVCLDVSKQILQRVRTLQYYKSLDVTWQTGGLFVLTIATSIYGHWERRNQMNLQMLNELRQDLSEWLSVMADMDTHLGSGGRLLDMIRTTIDSSLPMFNQFWHNKNTSPPNSGVEFQHAMPSDVHHVKIEYSPYSVYPSNTNENRIPSSTAMNSSYLSQTNNMGPAPQNIYANPPQYAYSNPEPYPGAARRQYQTPLQQQHNSLPPSGPTTNAYISSYPHQPPYGGSYPGSSAAGPEFYQAPGSPTSWRQFAGNIVPNLESNTNEYLSSMSSASALMSMGNGMGSNSGSGVVTDSGSGTPDLGMRGAQGQNPASAESHMWPGMVFDPSSGIG